MKGRPDIVLFVLQLKKKTLMKQLDDSLAGKYALEIMFDNKNNRMCRSIIYGCLSVINFKIDQITSEDGYASRGACFFRVRGIKN